VGPQRLDHFVSGQAVAAGQSQKLDQLGRATRRPRIRRNFIVPDEYPEPAEQLDAHGRGHLNEERFRNTAFDRLAQTHQKEEVE
jgi:hypothetical protein